MHGKPASAAAQRYPPGIVRDTGTRGVETNFLHRDIEATTVFGFINGVGGGAIMVTPNSSKHALQLQRAVQRPSGRPWSAAPHPDALFR